MSRTGVSLAGLDSLITRLGRAADADHVLPDLLTALPLEDFHPLPEELRASPAGQFLSGLHRLNLAQTWRRDFAR